MARGPAADGDSAARTWIGLFLQHDVDDAGGPGGVIARRRIGNDLDLVDDARRQLREKVAELRRLHRTRAAVDLDDHAGVAAQADDVVDVDVDGGHIAQHVECGAAASRRHVANDVGVAVRSELGGLLVHRNDDGLQLERHRRERHRAEVDGRG